MTRSLNIIAKDIRKDWGLQMSPAAKPYYEAMTCLVSLQDRYGMDSARHIVLYFLANAGTWRGETARAVKKELNAMLKGAS